MLVCTAITQAKYGGGSGTSDDPYLLFTPKHLAQIGTSPEDWANHFKMMADIDMRDYNGVDGRQSLQVIGYLQWQPYDSRPFRGVFDGNGKRIINLSIKREGKDYAGLFGYVDGNAAMVKNLTIVNPIIDAGSSMYVGAVVGKLRMGSIRGCVVEGGVITGDNCVGGLIGYNAEGTISNCTSTTIVSGNIDVGGIAGYHRGKIISGCSFLGKVSGRNDVGGVTGESDGLITNCFTRGFVRGRTSNIAGVTGTLRGRIEASYVKGQVVGSKEVGGFAGRSTGQIVDSYAQAAVTGYKYTGGFVGLLYNGGSVWRCYATHNTSVQPSQAENFVGWSDTGVVTASFWDGSRINIEEMMISDTYTAAGWDFVDEIQNGQNDLWDICEEMDFPRLSWQNWPAGDWICPEGVDIYDLTILFEHWLARIPSADLAGEVQDGIVNFKDLVAMGEAWGTKPGEPSWNARCDIWPDSGDGFVDIFDLTSLAENWLRGGKIIADIGDTGPDGIVNFIDWALFAGAWKSNEGSINWDQRCDLAPEEGDGFVDEQDLLVFIERWLKSGAGLGDIAPEDKGDGIVNLLDFVVTVRNFLDEV